MGFLANVDSTILKLNLDHGFKVDAMSLDEAFDFISVIEGLPRVNLSLELDRIRCLNSEEEKLYCIKKSFESDESGIKWTNAMPKFEDKYVEGYLIPIFKLMRLFKEGGIFMPKRYYWGADNDTPKPFIRMHTTLYIPRGPKYIIKDSEISDLNHFIQNTKLPFTELSLQLAFEHFDLSYHTDNVNLSFLSLMISLETLFNPADSELKYRISRNTAVLLGMGRTSAKDIFEDVKRLYNARSKLVHTGKPEISQENQLQLRQYVRESIKKIDKIGKTKEELLDILNSCGFGERLRKK